MCGAVASSELVQGGGAAPESEAVLDVLPIGNPVLAPIDRQTVDEPLALGSTQGLEQVGPPLVGGEGNGPAQTRELLRSGEDR